MSVNHRANTASSLDNQNALKRNIFRFLEYWPWILFSVVAGLGIAFFVIRNTTPIYQVKSAVLIKDENPRNFGMGSEMALMTGFTSDAYQNFYNQTILLKTPSQIIKTLNKLDFNICYYAKSNLIIQEFYPQMPFQIEMDSAHIQPLNLEFHLEIRDEGKLFLTAKGENVKTYNFKVGIDIGIIPEINFEQEITDHVRVESDYFSFTINSNGTTLKELAQAADYYFMFKSNPGMISEFDNITMEYAIKGSSIAYLYNNGSCLSKQEAFLNQLMETWIQDGLDQKNQIANNTINFINRQIAGLGDTLESVGVKLKQFKTSNKVIPPTVQAQDSYQKIQGFEVQEVQLKLKIDYLDQLSEYLNKREDYNKLIAPSVVGIENPVLEEAIRELSSMREELNINLGKNKLNNPYLIQLQKKESALLAGVFENINSIRENVILTQQFIGSEKQKSIADQNKLPEIEQQLLKIERDFNTTNELYTLLLQKNVEAQIQKASNVADNEIVEYASLNELIAPNRQKIIILGFSIGLFIPLILIVVKDFFNVRVQSLEDIQKITEIPLLGSIGIASGKAKIITAEEPTSPTAEAFRAVRTKLDFITKGEGYQTILISSTMPGEGKTFCAVNLAGILSIQDKKTIILGMDLRKPRLQEMFGLEDNYNGITNYLIGSKGLDDVIQSLGYPNLDCIFSGPIPPNPAELLNSKRTKELFDELKKRYDHIIIDTSPIGPVTDALLLNQYVDAFIYVVRQRHTVKQFFAHNISLVKELKPANLSILFNGIKFKNVGYGYGYGYHYGYGYKNKNKRRKFNFLRNS